MQRFSSKRGVSRHGRLVSAQKKKDRGMELQLPECPVCLQTYDSDQAIPRVLACGHTACEACITHLPQRFSDTIRCPACTQLVKYSHRQGPSALPKNIDLLRLCLSQESDYQEPQKRPITSHHEFLPRLWSDQFYSVWKDWVLPNDAVLVEPRGGEDFFDVIHARIAPSSSSSSSSWPLVIRWWIKENQNVSLVRIASLSSVNNSVFSFSYMGRIMNCLNGMNEEKKDELGLILRQCKTCGVYGLWYDLDSQCLYLVCERWGGGLLEKISELRNGDVSGDEDGLVNSPIEDGIFCFAMMGMELCKAIIGLHSEGLVGGCLAPSCFNFDGLGHVFVDLNEMLAIGRKIRRSLVESISGRRRIDDKEMGIISTNLIKREAFLSPEVFIELLQKEAIELECDSLSYSVGYSSDVWSLACMLLRLLIGNPFTELYIRSAKRHSGYLDVYVDCREEVSSLLETKLGTNFVALQKILCECLNLDPKSRPLVTDVWKCIRASVIKPQFDIMVSREGTVNEGNNVHCLVLGELCQLPKETNKGWKAMKTDESGREDVDVVGELQDDKDFVQGLSVSTVKSINLQGHLDCITGLAVGGGFLFSSSFDKTIHVWSLQDFTLVHQFRGHEHKVMAVVFVDEEQPLCISGDSGGGIFVWGISIPLGQEPLKKWFEQKDWRYSGIHSLAISGTGYLYTGSGDKSIKAWSLQDCTLSCTMNGHKSVVSALAVSDGVLYSGSWDGTIRLWSLNDHSSLTVLGEDMPGNVISVLSLKADHYMLLAAHEDGCIKIWRNDVFMKSIQAHNGAVFAVAMEGKWLFTGGWDKSVDVQEISGDDLQIETLSIGSIASDSVITALLYWQGKLFVGCADRIIKVYSGK